MNDIDRGAYTPGGERPLAFDARGGRGGARAPIPLALVGSATVLVVVVVGLVLAYRGDHGSGAVPRTVGEPVGAIKTAAAPEAATADPAAGAGVYTAQDVPVAKPNFAPPPEAPAARPAPTSLTVNTVDPAKVRIGAPLVEPAPTAADKAASASAATAVKPATAEATPHPVPTRPVQVASSPATTTSVTTSTAVKPAAKPPALYTAATTVTKTDAAEAPAATKVAKTDAAPATASSFKGAGVQIGAFSSRELADKGYADAMALAGKGGHGKAVEPVDHGGKTLFRTTVTGFADRAAAKAFCASLTAKGHSCIVKG